MPYIGTCFRFYKQVKVQKNTKLLPIKLKTVYTTVLQESSEIRKNLMTRGFGLDAFKLNILSQKLQNQFHTNAQYKLLHNVDLNQAEQSKKYECLREIGGQKKGLNFKFGSKLRHELSGQFFCFYFCNKEAAYIGGLNLVQSASTDC